MDLKEILNKKNKKSLLELLDGVDYTSKSFIESLPHEERVLCMLHIVTILRASFVVSGAIIKKFCELAGIETSFVLPTQKYVAEPIEQLGDVYWCFVESVKDKSTDYDDPTRILEMGLGVHNINNIEVFNEMVYFT